MIPKAAKIVISRSELHIGSCHRGIGLFHDSVQQLLPFLLRIVAVQLDVFSCLILHWIWILLNLNTDLNPVDEGVFLKVPLAKSSDSILSFPTVNQGLGKPQVIVYV